jgi:hypothetical protein
VTDNKKLGQRLSGGGWKLRVYRRKPKAKIAGGMLIKCGCCDKRLEIYDMDGFLEINGVCAPVESWREVLLPLLGAESKGTGAD